MTDESPDPLTSYVTLWDWRRQITELYAELRGLADAETAWRLWRARRDRLFAQHPQSPLGPARRFRFEALDVFPYDPRFRFEIAVEAPEDRAPVPVATGTDGETLLLPFARTHGLARDLGGELVLYWIAGYGGGVFLPFRDATSGTMTYAGGRYLLDTIKGADLGGRDGRIVLDFNFAYHPSCSYSERWVCPLAPAANRLPQPVTAGERLDMAGP
ncbi:MAG: DUF1684 domain-containing protein [Geminicoccaceae bacterium]